MVLVVALSLPELLSTSSECASAHRVSAERLRLKKSRIKTKEFDPGSD